MKKFENIKRLDFLVSFKLIFENVNIGLNLGMMKRTFKLPSPKIQTLYNIMDPSCRMQDQMIVLF